MMLVKRELFLQQLESVSPGLSVKEEFEQSSSFVFKDGRVHTFNNEIACSQECDIGGAEGAVHAQVLLDILRKLPEEDIEVSVTDQEFLIKGKRRQAGVARDANVTLPIETVEKPTKWRTLHEDFLKSIAMVQNCASTNDENFKFTCVHVTPEWVEACDNYQMARATFETGFDSPILVRRDSIKHITSLGMTKCSESETWIHFKNPVGLILSCRRFVDDYHDLGVMLKAKGTKIVLPKGIAEAAERVAIVCDDKGVLFHLLPGKVRLKGSGNSGWFREFKSIAYDGPELAFRIAPQLLIEITKKFNEAKISEGTFRVDLGNVVYVSCLSTVDEET